MATSIQPPSAGEYLSRFVEAFRECVPKNKKEQYNAWKNRTAFMTAKPRPLGRKAVLPVTAEKLNLKYEHECLRFDLVFFPRCTPWGIFVFIEHENVISGFSDRRYMCELEKLMSVLAPLKVGISYSREGNTEEESRLLKNIRLYFKTRHPSILESPATEYLFLLGIGEALDGLKWKRLLFTSGEGPEEKRFENVPNPWPGEPT